MNFHDERDNLAPPASTPGSVGRLDARSDSTKRASDSRDRRDRNRHKPAALARRPPANFASGSGQRQSRPLGLFEGRRSADHREARQRPARLPGRLGSRLSANGLTVASARNGGVHAVGDLAVERDEAQEQRAERSPVVVLSRPSGNRTVVEWRHTHRDQAMRTTLAAEISCCV